MSVEIIYPGGFTFDDLDALPDDGNQYELVDGILLVTPAPVPSHQRAVVKLSTRLELVCPDDCEVFVAPLDFRPSSRRSLQPDVLVARREDVGPTNITKPLLLAVEILSPATRSKDLLLKRALYEEAGVAAYWIFDPDLVQLTVLDLIDGRYVERAVVKGDQTFHVSVPFDIEITPADLVR